MPSLATLQANAVAEFPALPLWTDAYLADTRHLSTLEHGAYLLLMMEAWRRPHFNLPDDDALLARLAGLSLDQWESIKTIILAMWVLDKKTKTWTQKRLSKEARYVRQKSISNSRAAKSRWNKTEKGDANAMPNACQNDAPTPTPTPTPTRGIIADAITPQRKLVSARFTDDWKPGELPPTVSALTDLWPPGRLERELEQFRDYWLDKTTKRPGWDRTWHNRIRDIHDRVMRDNRNGNQTNGASYANGHDKRSGLSRAIDDGIEYLDNELAGIRAAQGRDRA